MQEAQAFAENRKNYVQTVNFYLNLCYISNM